jgi:hypothetical protein
VDPEMIGTRTTLSRLRVDPEMIGTRTTLSRLRGEGA